MTRTIPYITVSLTLLLFSAGCSATQTTERCYELVEGKTITTLVISEAEPATLTVIEMRNGEEVAPPQTTPGKFTVNSFTYPDGTTLVLTDKTLTWPEKSLLPNTVFTRSDCSN